MFCLGHRGYGSEEMARLHLEKLKRSPHSSMVEAENTPTTGLNGEAEIPSAESSPDLENMDSVFFAGGGHFDGDQDQLVDVSSPASVSEEDEELEHFGRRESLDNETFCCGTSKLEDQGSSNGDHQTKGGSIIMKDSHANEDSLTNGDSHETEDSPIEGDSYEAEYQMKGDSNKTENSPSKGDSLEIEDSHIEEESYEVEISQTGQDSNVTEDFELEEEISINGSKGDSPTKEDSLSKGELDSCSKENSLSVSDTCSLDNSPEKSPLSADGNFLNNNFDSSEYDSNDGKDIEIKNESTNHVKNHDEHEHQDKEVSLDLENEEGKKDDPYSSDEIEKNLSNTQLVESGENNPQE